MANNSIKGIDVEIGGSTVSLHNSLKGVNSSANSLQKELAQINKSLKFDPENAVLLAQKQEVLSEKITVTREKLESLKSVQSQVESQFKSGDLGADKYRAFQREIEQTMGHLDYLQGEFSETENKANKVDLSQFDSELNDLKESAGNLRGALSDTFADIGKGIAVAGAGVAGAVMNYDSVESALNAVQAKTGLADSKMKDLNSTIEAIYKNNYGDDMTDVANVMATVVQFTKETDPAKIQSMTENLFVLRDVFDYDYVESLRTANMLTKQFGITSDEAFNLIVRGTQNGLNKNGDFLDTLNEYSVHYKQLGYDANEFLNSLLNGTEAGTFSVDKLGDAMKEFGIRTKDTTTTTTEGFQLIGLDADVMRSKFAQGGETAQQATNDTITALLGLDDEVKRNQAGVDLFGSMWEDLGIDGVKALMNVSSEASNTTSTMEEIKDINYDDVKNDISSIGRKFQTDIVNPLIEDYYPDIEDAIEWTSEHLDDLVPIIGGVAGAMASMWVGQKINAVAQGITQVISTYRTLKTVTDSATIAQNALNVAQNSNVIGLAVGTIGTLVSIGMTLTTVFGDATEDTNALKDEQQQLYDKIAENIKAMDEMKAERDKEVSKNNSEFQYYKELKEELDQCVETNGTIKTGYEERADVIRNTLSEALGIDIEKTGNVLQNYKDISAELDNILIKKEAEQLLDIYGSKVKEARGSRDEYLTDYQTAGLNLQASADAVSRAESDYQNAIKEYQRVKREFPFDVLKQQQAQLAEGSAKQALEQAERDYETASSQYNEYQKKYLDTQNTINNYERLSADLVSGNTEKIKQTTLELEKNFQTSEYATKEMLQIQISNFETYYNDLKKQCEAGYTGITQDMVDEAELMVNRAEEELQKYILNHAEAGDDATDKLVEKTFENTPKVYSALENMGEQSIHGFKTTITEGSIKAGKDGGSGFEVGLLEKASDIEKAGWVLGLAAISGAEKALDINSPSKEGRKIGRNFADSIGLGADDERRNLKSRISSVSEILIDSFNNMQNADLGLSVTARLNAKAYEIAHQPKSNVLSKTITNAPIININFTGDMKLSNSSDIDELTDKIGRKLAQQIQQEALLWG